MKRCVYFLFLVIVWSAITANSSYALRRQYKISGKTMGTFYTVKFISKKKESVPFWQARVNTLLKQINKRMSMYDPKSELTMFNKTPAKEIISLSTDLSMVLTEAEKLHTMTGGAWDGTVKPLVDLWGFGTGRKENIVPAQHQITNALSGVGFNRILLKENNTAVKTGPVTLDLGSIAKGYGVDKVLHLFTVSGITDVLVEIGGELAGMGKNYKRKLWRVGINRPDKAPTGQSLVNILHLKDQAIATSGDYRNYFEKDGKTYSHIIDPRTGYPTTNNIVSASVISKTCMFADGLATALMVMDIKDSLFLVNRTPDTECLIIRNEEGRLVEYSSDGFERLLNKAEH